MESNSRITISLVIAWAVLVALLLAPQQLGLDAGVRIVLVALFLPVLPYLAGPLIVYQTRWIRSEPHFLPVVADGRELPTAISSSVFELTEQLEDAGFTCLGIGYCLALVPAVDACVALLEHETTGEVAEASVTFSRGASTAQDHCWINLRSKLADGSEINTGNATLLDSWPSDPRKHFQGFPSCFPAWRLLQIHRARVTQLGLPVVGDDALDEGACGYLTSRNRNEIECVADRGYLALDERSGVYRPTWWGAAAMSWRLTWPVSWFRRASRRLRAWHTLHALRDELSPVGKKPAFSGDEP